MKSFTKFFALFAVAVLFSSASLMAQPYNLKSDTKKEKALVPPKTVDFRAQLGSTNTALDKVGEIIDEGRQTKNVKTLLSAAMILFLEENTQEKKAQITGMELLKEASEIAEGQKNSQSLYACAYVWGSIWVNDAASADKYNKLAASFEGKGAGLRGPGAKECSVQVENHFDQRIYVYIDDVYKGYVEPGYWAKYTNIGLGTTKLYAETEDYWVEAENDYFYSFWEYELDLKAYKDDKPDFTWKLQ